MTGERLAYVTGATGFVGSHLVRRLLLEGFRVRALVFEKEGSAELEALGVECIGGDLTGPSEALRPGLSDVTHVFHLAAVVHDWTDRRHMVDVNVRGLVNLLEALPVSQIQRFVCLSSIVVYGDRDRTNADESMPFVDTGDNYTHTKIRCEKVLWEFVERTGLPAVVLRPPCIYGERDNQLLPRLCRSIKTRSWVHIGQGRVPFMLVSASNVVQACWLAVTRPEAVGEGFIIADPHPITRRELIELVCQEMGYCPVTAALPRWFVGSTVWVHELTARLLRRPPLINRFIYQFAAQHMTYDLSKARRLLGYDPCNSTLDAVRDSVRWFRKNRPELLPTEDNN